MDYDLSLETTISREGKSCGIVMCSGSRDASILEDLAQIARSYQDCGAETCSITVSRVCIPCKGRGKKLKHRHLWTYKTCPKCAGAGFFPLFTIRVF